MNEPAPHRPETGKEKTMADPLTWGCPEVTLAAPAAVSLDATAIGDMTSLVGNPPAKAQLAATDDPLNLVQAFSVRIPLTVAAGQSVVGYVQDLTFGIQKSAGGRVVILADLAGVVKTLEFDFEASTAAPTDGPLSKERVFSPLGLDSAGAGVLGLPGPVPDYQASFLLAVQRRGPNEIASVSIDGLDIFAVLGPAAAPPSS